MVYPVNIVFSVTKPSCRHNRFLIAKCLPSAIDAANCEQIDIYNFRVCCCFADDGNNKKLFDKSAKGFKCPRCHNPK